MDFRRHAHGDIEQSCSIARLYIIKGYYVHKVYVCPNANQTVFFFFIKLAPKELPYYISGFLIIRNICMGEQSQIYSLWPFNISQKNEGRGENIDRCFLISLMTLA